MNGLIMQIQPKITEVTVPAGYYLDIEFTTGTSANTYIVGLDSGLATGSDYPAVVTVPSSGTKVKLNYSTDTTLTVETATTAADALVADFITTMPNDHIGGGANDDVVAGTPVFCVYTLDSADTRNIKHELYYQTGSLPMVAGVTGNNLAWDTRTVADSLTNGESPNAVELKLQADDATATTGDYWQVVFPTGTILSSPTLTNAAGGDDVWTAINYFSSPTRLFKYPSVVFD